MSLIDNIKRHEGFSGVVYKCSEGFDTMGYGTRMPITKEEATLLLQHRLDNMIRELIIREPFYNSLPQTKADIIAEMCYQLGVSGVLNFKKMWKALKEENYEEASIQMLDSMWAVQTPNRAKELSDRMRNR